MSWRGSCALAVALAVYASFGGPSRALAAEAFVCGPDTIVYVEAANLEAMKRTNACIAAHYGLTLDSQKSIRKPDQKSEAAARALRSLNDAELTERSPEPLRRPVAALARADAPATAGTIDFRTIKILNAQSDADTWFHHNR